MTQKTILNLAVAPNQDQDIDLPSYDKIIVYFSGGKDSLALPALSLRARRAGRQNR